MIFRLLNKRKIIIFKNDASGDLTHMLREAIYNIIHSNKDKEYNHLFIRTRSKQFYFFI